MDKVFLKVFMALRHQIFYLRQMWQNKIMIFCLWMEHTGFINIRIFHIGGFV